MLSILVYSLNLCFLLFIRQIKDNLLREEFFKVPHQINHNALYSNTILDLFLVIKLYYKFLYGCMLDQLDFFNLRANKPS